MIDRQPNMDTARAAAAALDVELGQVEPEISAAAPSTNGHAGPPVLDASRAQLIAFGTILVGNLSTNVARRWGAHWVYSAEESKCVATAALDVADLYLGELEGPWWNLAIVLLATAVPRLLGEKLPPLKLDADGVATSPTGPEVARARAEPLTDVEDPA